MDVGKLFVFFGFVALFVMAIVETVRAGKLEMENAELKARLKAREKERFEFERGDDV